MTQAVIVLSARARYRAVTVTLPVARPAPTTIVASGFVQTTGAAVTESWRAMPEPSDEALATRVADGDLTAFSALYDRYERPVYVMAAHLLGGAEAEEVVQETFLRLWRSAAQFDEARGRFAPWLLAIARHEVLARLRRRSREQRWALVEEIDRLLAATPDPAIDVEEQVWRRTRGDLILQALNELPAEQRRVLVLAYFGELSQATIAASLGWPLGTVKKRVRLGLQKLRQALAPHNAAADSGSVGSDGNIAQIRPRDRVPVDDGA
jgi:RNA polymerase sigma-70 factor, ECF subfamily